MFIGLKLLTLKDYSAKLMKSKCNYQQLLVLISNFHFSSILLNCKEFKMQNVWFPQEAASHLNSESAYLQCKEEQLIL